MLKPKLTMRDLLATKGRRKLTMTNAADYNTARAAEEAGIDIITARGLWDERQLGLGLDQVRQGAPNTLVACNLPPTVAYVSDAEAIRCAMLARDHGADLIYSSGNTPARLGAIAELGIPVAGHVGLVPIRATWLGGLRAVGKTLDEAVEVYRQTLAFQAIGQACEAGANISDDLRLREVYLLHRRRRSADMDDLRSTMTHQERRLLDGIMAD